MEENSSTVFVRNLPFGLTSKRLTEVFSDVAPVKKAAIVRTANLSKGYGFVRFMFPEDAEAACERLNGTVLEDRKMLVERAHKKSERFHFEKKKKTTITKTTPADGEAQEPRPPKRKLETDLNHRFVLVFNFENDDEDETSTDLTEIVQNLGGNNGLVTVFPALSPNSNDMEPEQYSMAVNLMKKLEAMYSAFLKTLSPSNLIMALYSSSAFARQSVLSMNHRCHDMRVAETVWSLISIDKAAVRQWNRVIVRNISFAAKETDVTSCLKKFGVWLNVHLPLKQSDSSSSHSGYAFVTFALKSSATLICSLEDPIMCCERRLKCTVCELVQPEKKEKTDDVIVIDKEDKDDEDYTPPAEDDDDDKEEDDNKEEDKPAEEEEEEEPITKRPRYSDVGLGKTIFVRGIPFSSTNADLLAAFQSFGATSYALVVPQRENANINKGCGFVKFLNPSDASRAIEMSHHVAIDGRSLLVTLAQEKASWSGQDDDDNTSDDASKKKRKEMNARLINKRHVYLIHEGTISKQKKKKQEEYLTTNTMNLINPCRLCIRGLAPAVSNILLSAVASKLATLGLSSGLVRDADVLRLYQCTKNEEERQAEMLQLHPVDDAKPVFIKKSQIIRNLNKPKIPSQSIPNFLLDKTNKKRMTSYEKEVHETRGFGFVDFSNHVQALASMRYFEKIMGSVKDDDADEVDKKQFDGIDGKLDKVLTFMKSSSAEMTLEFCMEDYMKSTRLVRRSANYEDGRGQILGQARAGPSSDKTTTKTKKTMTDMKITEIIKKKKKKKTMTES